MATATKKKRTRAPKLDLNNVVITEVKPSPGYFTTGVPEDHPLALAFKASQESGDAVSITTATIGDTEKWLRKIADSKGLGLRVSKDGDVLTFQVKERTTRSPKAQAQEPEADEAQEE